MTKKSSNDSKSESSANMPRVGRTIPLEEGMLKRTLYDALHNPIPFPQLEKASENETSFASEQGHPEPGPSSELASRTVPDTAVEALLGNLAEQQNVNEGQRRVNGQLCRVDWMLVEALRALRVELAKLPAAHSLDFEKIDNFLSRAYQTNGSVAEIRPPGCEPALVPDPNWTVTKTKVA